jgi:hypothetical protein
MRKVISDIQVAFIKTAIIIIIAAAVATIVSVFIYPSLSNYIGVLEGMTPATTDDKSKDSKDSMAAVSAAIPKEDDDLKCPGAKRKDVKCEVADIIRLGYELASDPIMSQTEQNKFHAVFSSRSKDTADKKLANLINRFMGDVMLLRFTVMFNTKPNETELKKTLDKMIKDKDTSKCYSLDDMKQVKGLLVGTAEQKTLTVAQSEAIRCYMQRFNSVRACMGICDDKKV